MCNSVSLVISIILVIIFVLIHFVSNKPNEYYQSYEQTSPTSVTYNEESNPDPPPPTNLYNSRDRRTNNPPSYENNNIRTPRRRYSQDPASCDNVIPNSFCLRQANRNACRNKCRNYCKNIINNNRNLCSSTNLQFINMCGDVRDDICSTDNENFDFYGKNCKKIENRSYAGICLDPDGGGPMVRLNCPRACANYCNDNFRTQFNRRNLIEKTNKRIHRIEREHLDINENDNTSRCKSILETKCSDISTAPFTCEL